MMVVKMVGVLHVAAVAHTVGGCVLKVTFCSTQFVRYFWSN